jgi:predicted small lipoprotein YifL
MRRLAALLLVAIVLVPLLGCGKKGAPEPPPGEPDTYPRTYPSSHDQDDKSRP